MLKLINKINQNESIYKTDDSIIKNLHKRYSKKKKRE